MKIAVVTNLPRPYRHALFNEVARELGAGHGLAVVYCSAPSQHPRRRPAESDFGDRLYATLQAPAVRLSSRGEKVRSIALSVPRLLHSLDADVIVAAGFGPDAMLVHLAARRLRAPVVAWSGAWPGGEARVVWLQQQVRRRIVAASSAFLTYGSLAGDYVQSLGAEATDVAVAVNTVDLDHFALLAETARASLGDAVQNLGLSERNLLFVGSLVERKGVCELVEAFTQMDTDNECTLHLVGLGPLESELRRRAETLRDNKRVRFHGFLQEDGVARLCGLCDVFVCPSLRELWGLVINEAMACGLPVIASKHAGATHDLITHDREGYVVDPRQPRELAEKMGLLVRDPELARSMGRRAALTVRERASLEVSARGFIRGVEIALDRARGATRAAC